MCESHLEGSRTRVRVTPTTPNCRCSWGPLDVNSTDEKREIQVNISVWMERDPLRGFLVSHIVASWETRLWLSLFDLKNQGAKRLSMRGLKEVSEMRFFESEASDSYNHSY